MARKAYHEKMRPELLKQFNLCDDDTRSCFGSQPQGGDSAEFQGCPYCDRRDKCSDATVVVRAALPKDYYKKANRRYSVKKDNRGPYVHDARMGYDEAMSAAEIVKILNKYNELKGKA
jgi:hypothetical protein